MKNVLFIIFFLSIIGCDSCEKKCINIYRFQLPFSLSPQIDTFKIGDTVWVSSDFSKEVIDLNSGEGFDLENFDFRSKMSIKKIDMEPFEDANLEFDVIEDQGSLELTQLVGTTTFSIYYIFEEEKYKIKFGLIPSKEGLFSFGLFSLLPNNFDDFEILPNCDEQIEHIDYLLNDGLDNNYEFIQLSADSTIRTTTKEIFDTYGHYCFYVVE